MILGSHTGFPPITSVPQESIWILVNQARSSAIKSASGKSKSAFWQSDWIGNNFTRMRHIRLSSISLDLQQSNWTWNGRTHPPTMNAFQQSKLISVLRIGLPTIKLDFQQSTWISNSRRCFSKLSLSDICMLLWQFTFQLSSRKFNN